jgi:hypothetical protein
MRRTLIAAMQAALLGCTPALAQVSGVGIPTPGIASTSPFGMVIGSPVPPVGIPLGATELASPGLSPPINSAIGMPVFGTTCSAIGSSSGTPGLSTYDGGGMGTATSSSVSAADCSAGSGDGLSAPVTSPVSPGGVARSGIPLGSVEMSNAGESPLLIVPAPSPSTSGIGTLSPFASTTGPLSPYQSTLAAPGPSPGMMGLPCTTIGATTSIGC